MTGRRQAASWRLLAACRNAPPRTFYPASTARLWSIEVAAEAKAYCADCPVTAECLAFANAHGEVDGVWGGLTPWERGVRTRPDRGGAVPPERVHGTDYCYLGGCRCEECKAAKSRSQADYYARRVALGLPARRQPTGGSRGPRTGDGTPGPPFSALTATRPLPNR